MRSNGTVRTTAPGEGGGGEGGGDGDGKMGGGDSCEGDRGSKARQGQQGTTEAARAMGVMLAVLTSFEVLCGHEATAVQRALGGHANTARAPTVRSQPLHRVARPSLHVTAAGV